ncbi:hypothetical protein [uncultured Psychroserpens sp.]|uniref:hypothetical protein n=1 Tax=uncultured Psychroserpens sp. TaxID=255436 RepID=UPI00261D7ABF|nr:hypothetical protein [uncultured Psychroserpens sp.]
MKSNLLFFFLFFSFLSFAQLNYEPGYIIDNQNKRTEVYIKNVDWNNNPTEFKYRLSKASKETLITDIENVKEFGIGDYIKFERFSVDIDQSSSRANKLSITKEPEYLNQTVFLKQLIEGDADLFYFHDNDKNRFFIRIGETDLQPLVYKKYLLTNKTLGTNSTYKKQIFDELKCESITLDQTRDLKYSKDDLKDIVSKYNMCSSSLNKVYENPNKKIDLNLSVKVGYFNSSLDVVYDGGAIAADRQGGDLGSQSSYRIAAELEYMLSSKSKRWSVFIEPGFQSYESSVTIFYESVIEANRRQDISVDYKYIDVPIGLRHYFLLSEKSKIFVNAAYVIVFDMSDKIEYSDNPGIVDLDIRSSPNLLFGIGYEFDNRFNIEARINTMRDITNDYTIVEGRFNSVGVVLGYKLF